VTLFTAALKPFFIALDGGRQDRSGGGQYVGRVGSDQAHSKRPIPIGKARLGERFGCFSESQPAYSASLVAPKR
jgi:hypothetical protein